MQKPTIKQVILAVFVLLFLINVILLDIRVFWKNTTEDSKKTDKEINLIIPTQIPNKQAFDNNYICPQNCIDIIKDATSSIQSTVKPSIVQTENIISQIETSPKETYIPLGTGITKNTSWTDLVGIEAYIDPKSFGTIKQAVFEATLKIPTANGKAFARLYNVNDKRPVWFSEVTSEGQNSTMVMSGNLTFENGNKLYRVQMYSSMGYDVFLDNARIKIIYQ